MEHGENRQENDIGNLKISEDVISTIAGVATSEIKGVSGLSSHPSLNDKKRKVLIGKKSLNKSIRLEMKDGEATIDIFVNLYMGARIPETASEIQARVKDAVQNMTGISVSKVNVHIAGVVISQGEAGELA